ncbi:MAG: hypothetical protein PHR20_05465 [Bacteroidales bacterium]|nr:hypothetical protein [Bacteroidales bacterium]
MKGFAKILLVLLIATVSICLSDNVSYKETPVSGSECEDVAFGNCSQLSIEYQLYSVSRRSPLHQVNQPTSLFNQSCTFIKTLFSKYVLQKIVECKAAMATSSFNDLVISIYSDNILNHTFSLHNIRI